ncbi:MAG: hypothetical protein IJ189_11725 [Clostridia bacterium]|nr:hypothetical protein [Clostridia bacterium]
MQNNNTKKQKPKRELVYKPYLKGNWHGSDALKKVLKVLSYYLIFAFLFVVTGSFFSSDTPGVAWGANLVILILCAALLYNEGAREGESQVALGEIAYGRKEAGKEVPQAEQSRCFHPLKGWFTALCAVLPLILLTGAYAVQAQKQVYQLQALPEWVSSYESGSEVMLPLSYYQANGGITPADILRLITRVLVFPFAQIARLYGADALLTLDRWSPLLVCVPALGYPLGYLTGPRSRAAVHGDIKSNNKKYQRRQRKAMKARQQRAEKKNELI